MFQEIDDGISVAGQLDESGIAAAIEAGFRTIICNRPDSEDGAVPHMITEAAARQGGVTFHYLPVQSALQTPDDVRQMADILASAEKPVLAYCRSGARSANLYGLTLQLG